MIKYASYKNRDANLMLRKFGSWIAMNKKLIILTFEVFWILVFLLDRVTNVNSVEIPQFIYVNF